jgi:hypothetical protein
MVSLAMARERPLRTCLAEAATGLGGLFGQRFQRRGAVQGAVKSALIVVRLVLTQDPPQMIQVQYEGAVEELAGASPDPAFCDRVHAGRPHVAEHGPAT